MGWYCVHFEPTRLSRPLNKAFRNTLFAQYKKLGEPEDCWVYYRQHDDLSDSYYFSPRAYEHFSELVNFWLGTECPEPAERIGFDVVI